ncbi:MAG TPA: hypothetical protein VF733_05695 [Candidatus Saccharimonadales bacterium]
MPENMSTPFPAIESIDLPPPEEQAPPPPLPSVAFAEHVAFVREHGDALTNSPQMQSFTKQEKLGIGSGFVAGVIGSALPGYAILGPLGSSLAAYHSFRKATKKYADQASDYLRGDDQLDLRQEYDLYAGNKNVPFTLRWYGPLFVGAIKGPRESADHLLAMATLAQDNGITHMAVGKDVLEALRLPERLTGSSSIVESHFLKKRNVTIEKDQGKNVLLLAPTECWLQEITQFKEGLEPISVPGFIDKLRSFRPEHPLVAIYDAHHKYPAQLREKLERATAEALQRRLNEPISISNRAAFTGDDLSGEIAKKKKLISTAQEIGNGTRVLRIAEGEELGVESMLEALGIQEAEIMSLLGNPDLQPMKSQKLLELLLYNAIRGKHSFAPTATNPSETESFTFGDLGPTAQEILLGVGTPAADKKLQFARSGAARWASTFFFAIALSSVSAYVTRAVGVDDVLKHQAGQVWDYASQAWEGDPPEDVSSNPLFDGLPGPEEPPKILYSLTSHGLPVDGYWTKETSNVVYTDAKSDQKKLGWVPMQEVIAHHPLPTQPDSSKPNIEVKKDSNNVDSQWVTDAVVARIPVRLGTRPIAARLGDQAVELMEYRGGSFGIKIPENPHGVLTYWLGQDEQGWPYAVPGVHTPGENANWADLDNATIYWYWRDRLPELPFNSFDRAVKLAGHIAAYQYVLRPSTDTIFGTGSEWSSFVRTADTKRQVNCFTANTLNVVSNPGELNYADGYRNNGDLFLTNRESHAWSVARNRTLIDATPSSLDPHLAGYFDALPPAPKEIPFPMMPAVLLGGLVTTCALYGARRPLFIRPYRSWADYPLKTLIQTDDSRLALSTQITDALLFAPPDRDIRRLVAPAEMEVSREGGVRIYKTRHALLNQLVTLHNPAALYDRLGPVREGEAVKAARSVLRLLAQDRRRQMPERMVHNGRQMVKRLSAKVKHDKIDS